MACTTNTSTFRLGAARVSWGKKHKSCYSLDSASISGGEYIEFSNSDTDFYAYFDVDNGNSDPAVAGKTGIEIDLTSGMCIAYIGE